MARSKNNKKMKGGVWYDPSTWVYTKGEEVKKEETTLLNESTSTQATESTSPSAESAKEQTGLLSSPSPVATAPVEEKSWKNLWGFAGGKSKKAKKMKANKTKKSKK